MHFVKWFFYKWSKGHPWKSFALGDRVDDGGNEEVLELAGHMSSLYRPHLPPSHSPDLRENGNSGSSPFRIQHP